MRLFWIPLLSSCTFVDATTLDKPPAFPTNPTSAAGTTPVPMTEEFVQERFTAVDVLFVLDTSGVVTDPTLFGQNTPLWMDHLLGTGVDYHVGLVTADLDDPNQDGKLVEANGQKWIDAHTPNPIDLLAAMADLGTGAPTAQPFGAAYRALEVNRDTFNAGFLRDGSALHVVVVSDGDDGTDPTIITQPEFVDWLDELRPEDRSFSCLDGATPVGTTCADTVAQLGGLVGGLEAPEAHADLGLLFAGLTREFFLANVPIGSTIEVEVEEDGVLLMFQEAVGDPLVGDWTYDPVANSVTFLEYVPNVGATVRVSYSAAP